MIEVSFSSSFKRAFKRNIAGKRDKLEKFWKAVDIFRNDPFLTSLKTHKLSGKLKHVLSFSVEYDLRIIFYFSDSDRATFIDIGTHDDVY